MARARIAGRPHAVRSDVKRAVSNVVSVICRTPAAEAIEWTVDVPNGLFARIDADDLSELLGNLTENAVRYGRQAVSIAGVRDGDSILIEIADDGPGIPEEKLGHVLRRGTRLDTSSGGAGLGLAISESIVQSVGGDIQLANGAPGLRASIRLPAADG
nr:ATP-binding protein [Rhizobium rhizolycopersici]